MRTVLALIVGGALACALASSVVELAAEPADATQTPANCKSIRESLPWTCEHVPEKCAALKEKLRSACPEVPAVMKKAPAEEGSFAPDEELGEGAGRRGGGGFMATSGSFSISSNRAGNSEDMDAQDLGSSQDEARPDPVLDSVFDAEELAESEDEDEDEDEGNGPKFQLPEGFNCTDPEAALYYENIPQMTEGIPLDPKAIAANNAGISTTDAEADEEDAAAKAAKAAGGGEVSLGESEDDEAARTARRSRKAAERRVKQAAAKKKASERRAKQAAAKERAKDAVPGGSLLSNAVKQFKKDMSAANKPEKPLQKAEKGFERNIRKAASRSKGKAVQAQKKAVQAQKKAAQAQKKAANKAVANTPVANTPVWGSWADEMTCKNGKSTGACEAMKRQGWRFCRSWQTSCPRICFKMDRSNMGQIQSIVIKRRNAKRSPKNAQNNGHTGWEPQRKGKGDIKGGPPPNCIEGSYGNYFERKQDIQLLDATKADKKKGKKEDKKKAKAAKKEQKKAKKKKGKERLKDSLLLREDALSQKKKAKKSKADKKASKAKKKDKKKDKKEDKKAMKELNKNSMDWNRVGNKKDLYGKWYQPTQNVCNAVSCKNKNAWRKQARAANANCIISWGFVRKKYRGLPGFLRWKGLTRLPAGQHTPQQDNKVFKDFHNATVTWEMEQKKTKAAKAKALIAAAAKAKGGANREEQSSLVLLEEDSLSDKVNKDKKAKKAKKEKKKAKKKDDKKKKKKAKKDANRC